MCVNFNVLWTLLGFVAAVNLALLGLLQLFTMSSGFTDFKGLQLSDFSDSRLDRLEE